MSGTSPAADPAETVDHPVARLEASRQRLRLAMQARRGGHRAGGAGAPSQAAGGGKWRESLASIPGVSIVVDALESWWRQHPLRVATMVGSEAARAVFEPAARRRPWLLVAGAVAAGAVVVWARPWRWGLVKPALFTGLVTQFASKALAQVPVASWLAVLSQLAPQPGAAQAGSADAPTDGGDGEGPPTGAGQQQ